MRSLFVLRQEIGGFVFRMSKECLMHKKRVKRYINRLFFHQKHYILSFFHQKWHVFKKVELFLHVL